MKKYIIRFVLIILIAFSILVLNFALMPKTEHGIMQARCMYSQPKDSIDVVMLGSSHIHCDINTALLWEDYGISAYDYSAAEQPLWITYYYLKEICKTQKPKVAVLDLYGPAHYKDDFQYEWLADNLFGFRFSLNKIQMMTSCLEFDQIDRFFPAFFSYHNNYKELANTNLLQDFFDARKENETFKGYTPYFYVQEQTEPEIVPVGSGGLTPKSEIYLLRIINYCKENNIELFLIVTPYITNDADELVYNRIKEISSYEGIDFNSTNYDYSNMGLNFEDDFNDSSHLNYSGSCKFTKYLADELLSRFELEDHRGDSYYDSWYKHCEIIDELVTSQMGKQ